MEIISESDVQRTTIQKFYCQQNILITGGTGFIGRILIEKLLRSCDDINTIYLIVRGKKGKDMNTRIGEIFQCPIFAKLKEESPKYLHKVHGIQGDCSLPGLGLSASDRQLLISEVSIVFHAAATVRFDEKIRLAMLINLKGTQEIIDLSKQMKNLKSVVHVSTAYAHCTKNMIAEEFYKCPIEPEKLESLIRSADDKLLDNITPLILGECPNTYAYTKALAEELVIKEGSNLPIGIVRPGIVISTYKEPIKGWIDNVYGPTGICVGAGSGVLRTIRVDPHCTANIVPVDMCVNSVICSAWKISQVHEHFSHNKLTKTQQDIPIYNYVSNVDRPITWKKFMYMCELKGMNYPSVRAIWYYNLTLNKYWIIHWIYTIFLHLLPAVFIDGALICMGKSPQLLKTYIKIVHFSNIIKYFTLRSFNFKNSNTKQLWKDLDKTDQNLFPFDMQLLDWDDYFEGYMKGIRLYLFKEQMDNLPEASKRWNILYWLHQITKFVFAILVIKILWNLLSMFI